MADAHFTWTAMSTKAFRIVNALLLICMLSISTLIYAKSDLFHAPYFDISLVESLKLISKTEQKENAFYRYVFGSSSTDDAELQMRVIVSSKGPDQGQSLEAFQASALANMNVMFMEAYGLYQYLNKPENKKVLNEKPGKIKLGDTTFVGITMYFGNMDVSFLVTSDHDMTFAFTLISKNANEQIRKENLKKLTEQLQTIKFNSVVGE